MTYEETENYIIKTDLTGVYYIPKDPDNRDYQEYLSTIAQNS